MEFAKQKAVWQILRCSILRQIWMLCGNFRPKARQVVCRRVKILNSFKTSVATPQAGFL